jgi:serine/threonine protein kinase
MSEKEEHPTRGIYGNLSSSAPSESERFAHFTICRLPNGDSDCLGAGAMGITYRAYDQQLERYVALKVISPQHLHNPGLRVRFLREAKAAARIQHPNIANVLYQGEQNGTCFYVMELVSGESLESYVCRVGPPHPVHALHICHQVTLALDAAFKEQLLHRDLKPGNIMLTSYHDGRQHHVKVIDFGLAKFLSEAPGSFATMSGFIGTPSFASPEQCQEVEVDCRSDLYSLGATLWFILSGRSPFQGSTLSVIQAHVYDALPFENLGNVPEPVLELLQRLLAKKPEDRPATPLHAAYEIECAIEALGGSQAGPPPPPLKTITAPEAPKPERSRRKTIIVALSILAGLGLAIAVAFLNRRQPVATQKTIENTAAAAMVMAEIPTPQPTPTLLPTPVPTPVPTAVPTPLPTPVPTPTASPVPTPIPTPMAPPAAVEPKPEPKVFVNSLGMRFVGIDDLQGQISVWETRVKDFETFIKEAGTSGTFRISKKQPRWDQPGFPQSPEDPVVNVSLEDALQFCRWLTKREREQGLIPKNQAYRLLEPYEFDKATGQIPDTSGGNLPPSGPAYLWGKEFPPPPDTGNFADETALESHATSKSIENYLDGRAHTAPVGSYKPNTYGLYDMAGNAWELVAIQQGRDGQILKFGGGWSSAEPYMFGFHYKENLANSSSREADLGFRCFLSEENSINMPPHERNRPKQ